MTKYMIEFRVESDGKSDKDEGDRVTEIANRLHAELPEAEDVRVLALDDEDSIIASCEEA